MFEKITFQDDMYKVICKIPNKHVGNRKLKSEYKADHFILEKIIDADFEEI